MYHCELVLTNMDDWIEYVQDILAHGNISTIDDATLEKIMQFDFKFGLINSEV